MNDDKKPSINSPHTLAWDVNDVARELKVSVRHVFGLVHQNRIPYAKVGRLLRFSPGKIRDWLEKGGTR